MKIKILCESFVFGDVTGRKGETIDVSTVPDHVVRTLIKRKKATEVVEKKAKE